MLSALVCAAISGQTEYEKVDAEIVLEWST